MTNTPHGQVLEALIDLIDAYAETRHRRGGIYNARIEVARKAVIEAPSGVQALSAAPEAIAKLRHLYQNMVNGAVRDTASAKRIAEGLLAPAIEALERATPPAEQQAQPGAVGRTGCTAGTDEECTRRGCATSCPALQAAPKAAPGEPVASAAKGAIMGAAYDFRDAHISGSMNLKRSAHAALEAAVDSALAAPQQEAQEPVATLHCNDIGYVWARATEVGTRMRFEQPINLYTAPQQEAQEPTEIPEKIERMAADRYKVVPSHESMFHRWAVVAGTGTQQLYLGREVECQNMARKFAGAFLDGAFVAMQRTAPQPAPDCHHRPPCDECAALAAQGGKDA